MTSLTDFIKYTGNQFATIASDGITAGDVSNFVDSGSYTLNALLSGSIYGGFPGNKITVIASPTSTGKCLRGTESINFYFDSLHELDLFLKFNEDYSTNLEFTVKKNNKSSKYKFEMTYGELVDKLAPNRIVGEQVAVDIPIYVETPMGFSQINAVIEKPICDIIRLVFDNGQIYETSTEHLFSQNGIPVTAEKATVVDTMNGVAAVISKEIVAQETVFDISIVSPHWYISRDDGVIHHNSFFALGAAKHFLEQNPTGIVLLFESESAITKSMLVERNIDVNRFGVIPISTVQEFRTQALKIIENYEKESPKDRAPLFFILDSLGMLSTAKEMIDSAEGSDTRDMTRAQLIKATFRVLTLRLGRANIPMVVTNHVYAAVGAGLYAGNIQSGGSGSQYASSTILSLTKAKEKDATNEVIGAIISVTATKSRLTKENSKIKCLIRYDGGLDRYYGLLDLAEEAEIFKKVSTRYEMPDGSKVFGKAIMNNPNKYYTKDILDQLDEFCKKKFLYGIMNHNEIDMENEGDAE